MECNSELCLLHDHWPWLSDTALNSSGQCILWLRVSHSMAGERREWGDDEEEGKKIGVKVTLLFGGGGGGGIELETLLIMACALLCVHPSSVNYTSILMP